MGKLRPTRNDNVFMDRNKIYTINRVKGKTVYGERLLEEDKVEYRQWDPKRSKLGAAIAKNIKIPHLKGDHTWLYLGASSGTTVSHVSDILTDGIVYALDFAPRVLRELYFLSEKRKNIAPIFADANLTETFAPLVTGVDVLFQDIATREQLKIFLKNFRFLKKGGIAMLSLKARSIDVARKPKSIFKQVESELRAKVEIVDWGTLEPFEADHAFFVCRK